MTQPNQEQKTESFDVHKLLDFMKSRKEALLYHIDHDAGGGLVGRLEAYRETKYYIEAIERGEFGSLDI